MFVGKNAQPLIFPASHSASARLSCVIDAQKNPGAQSNLGTGAPD
jgi:hypothetical protein